MSNQKYFYLAYWISQSAARLWIGLLLIICSMWAIGASSADDHVSSEIPAENNRLVVCLYADINSLDPTNHRSRATQIVLKNIFDSLTARTKSNEVVPQLADSWRLIDKTMWQFVLRKGVRFHNGQKLTAADVKFTIDRVIHDGAIDGISSPRKSLMEPISEVIVVDDHTVHIKTRHPWPNLPLMLSMQEIIPAAYVQTVGTQGFESHPVGSGPFKFVRKTSNDTIILERFDGYYGGSPSRPPVQAPPLEKVIFKTVPSHLDQLAMLKAGRCDIISNVPPRSIPILNMSPGIRILTVQATRSHFAEINCTRPPLNDLRVRQALNYAIDMDAVINHKLQGHGDTLATVLLPNAFGYDPALKPYPYDPSIARRLLDAAAYPDGYALVIYSNIYDLMLADGIALYLTKLGLQTRMVVSPTFRPNQSGPGAPWDIFVGSWGNSTLDPVGILKPKFGSDGRGNYSGYSSAVFDRLISQAQCSMSEALRADVYRQIQTMLFNDAPMIFGYALNEYYGVTKRVKNFSPSVTGMIDLHDVYTDETE
jgi:peptide/nickel transport system substrate-binding protein